MVLCPEYSFVQFDDILDDCCCERPLEVAEASDLSFYVLGNITRFCLCNISGDIITEMDVQNGWITPDIDLSEYLACDDCFRFLVVVQDPITPIATINYYSNIFIYNKKSENPLVKYSSSNNSFFPFTEGKFNSVRLPIEIINRNPNTETEEYVDANGRINNPYKTRRDVYKLNVDYSPVDFHKKIQVMLMHDVFIDSIEINETGDYEINYGESIRVNNKYLYMASTEVSEQDILMMRNY